MNEMLHHMAPNIMLLDVTCVLPKKKKRYNKDLIN